MDWNRDQMVGGTFEARSNENGISGVRIFRFQGEALFDEHMNSHDSGFEEYIISPL